jgi:PilZ domain
MDAPPAVPTHSSSALRLGESAGGPRRTRRYPRFEVSWPVVVEVGRRFYLLQAVDVSGRGARVRPTERLGEGTVARLHFHPPTGPSFDVEAVVWRVDPRGLSFLFTADNQRRLTALLAHLPAASRALWTSTLS